MAKVTEGAAGAAADSFDRITLRLEAALGGVDAASGSRVKALRAESELLEALGAARDCVDGSLRARGGKLKGVFDEVFGGACDRPARMQIAVEAAAAALSEKASQDQRLRRCEDACATLEKVLEDTGHGASLREAKHRKQEALRHWRTLRTARKLAAGSRSTAHSEPPQQRTSSTPGTAISDSTIGPDSVRGRRPSHSPGLIAESTPEIYSGHPQRRLPSVSLAPSPDSAVQGLALSQRQSTPSEISAPNLSAVANADPLLQRTSLDSAGHQPELSAQLQEETSASPGGGAPGDEATTGARAEFQPRWSISSPMDSAVATAIADSEPEPLQQQMLRARPAGTPKWSMESTLEACGPVGIQGGRGILSERQVLPASMEQSQLELSKVSKEQVSSALVDHLLTSPPRMQTRRISPPPTDSIRGKRRRESTSSAGSMASASDAGEAPPAKRRRSSACENCAVQ